MTYTCVDLTASTTECTYSSSGLPIVIVPNEIDYLHKDLLYFGFFFVIVVFVVRFLKD